MGTIWTSFKLVRLTSLGFQCNNSGHPPEDAHGADHYYYLVIIGKSSEPIRLQLGYLQPMANCHTFLLQIIQINKIKHTGSAQKRLKKKKKKHDLSSFSLTQRAITRRSVITLGPIFTKMVLNQVQGSKEKSQDVSVLLGLRI